MPQPPLIMDAIMTTGKRQDGKRPHFNHTQRKLGGSFSKMPFRHPQRCSRRSRSSRRRRLCAEHVVHVADSVSCFIISFQFQVRN